MSYLFPAGGMLDPLAAEASPPPPPPRSTFAADDPSRRSLSDDGIRYVAVVARWVPAIPSTRKSPTCIWSTLDPSKLIWSSMSTDRPYNPSSLGLPELLMLPPRLTPLTPLTPLIPPMLAPPMLVPPP